MSVLQAEMEFEIGDIVYHKTALHSDERATPFIVIERFVQECHGGIQRQYRISSDRRVDSRLMVATELTKEKPVYEDPLFKAFKKNGIEVQKEPGEPKS